ncbi:hypothetical protein [Komagataeibacter oboediens]|uniref:hypothetical protein n=1 Tax=Komagataeibacter oboediens TaxID=65958 RepID=UPI000237E3D0|nr:hypothetical protein [Komagataeibacter oboediens]
MAIEVGPASNERRLAGFRVYQILDEIGLKPNVAAWVYDRESDYWWYMVATPLIDTVGPQWVFDRLLKAFQKIKLPDEVTPLDICLMSPNEAHVSKILKMHNFEAKGNKEQAFLMFNSADLDIDDMHYDNVLAYRISKRREVVQTVVRRFDKKVAQLIAA